MLFHTKFTGIKRGEPQGRDAHGQIKYGPDVEIAMRGELINGTAAEPWSTNARTPMVTNTFRLLLPPSNALEAVDKVRILGKVYRIDGEPVPILVGGRLHHYEAELKRISPAPL